MASRAYLLQVIKEVGPARFCAAVCDSTGSTVGSRTRIHLEVPIILPIPDAPHHINSFIKDVSLIVYFREVSRSFDSGYFIVFNYDFCRI